MSNRSSSSHNLPRIRDILGAELESSSGRGEHSSSTSRASHSDPRYPGSASRARGQAPGVPGTASPQYPTSWHPSGGAPRQSSSSNYTPPQAPSRAGVASPGPGMPHYPGSPAAHRSPSVPTLHPAVDWRPHGTRTPSTPHASEQMYRTSTPGPRSGLSPAVQPTYQSPQGALVEGMRAPGSTPMASSSYIQGSFPVIPEDQQPNARYVCASCGKRFSRPSSLRTHELSHSGIKPFECTYPGCGRRFSVQSNMRRHVTKVHERGGSSRQGESSEDEYEDESEICARH